MNDPISELINQIKNSTAIDKPECLISYSKFKEALLAILKSEKIIADYEVVREEDKRPILRISLLTGKIRRIARLSKPGRRLYVGYREVPTIMRGYGLVILSTPSGLMTGSEAKKQKIGGELICKIS